MEVKENKKSIKYISKDSSGMRLESIRISRDLTLGGSKIPKKTYKPNINVKRIRRKEIKSISQCEEINELDRNPEVVIDKFRERFIQSAGVFSEGIHSIRSKVRKNVESTTKNWYKSHKNVTETIKNSLHEDMEEQEDDVQRLLRYYDSSNSDSDDKNDFESITWSLVSNFVENKVSIDDEMKFSPNKISDNFNSTSSISLWQLPSSFGTKINFDASKTTTPMDVQLNEMNEGEIGRIHVKRSGKVELSVDGKKYHLKPTMLDTCSEKIISINVSPEKSDMTIFGEIDSSFILSPDWSYLLC